MSLWEPSQCHQSNGLSVNLDVFRLSLWCWGARSWSSISLWEAPCCTHRELQFHSFIHSFIDAAPGLGCRTRNSLVAACGLLVAACTCDLVPWPGIEPGPPALGAQSLTHWTTREVPELQFQTEVFHPGSNPHLGWQLKQWSLFGSGKSTLHVQGKLATSSATSLTSSLLSQKPIESEAVAHAPDPLRPSSLFSLLASISITATFILGTPRQVMLPSAQHPARRARGGETHPLTASLAPGGRPYTLITEDSREILCELYL